jgi:hypothetical protein
MTTHGDLELLRAIADHSADGAAMAIDELPDEHLEESLERLEAEGLIEHDSARDVPATAVRITAEGLLVLNPQNSR